jgi:hypothetical protein
VLVILFVGNDRLHLVPPERIIPETPRARIPVPLHGGRDTNAP